VEDYPLLPTEEKNTVVQYIENIKRIYLLLLSLNIHDVLQILKKV